MSLEWREGEGSLSSGLCSKRSLQCRCNLGERILPHRPEIVTNHATGSRHVNPCRRCGCSKTGLAGSLT